MSAVGELIHARSLPLPGHPLEPRFCDIAWARHLLRERSQLGAQIRTGNRPGSAASATAASFGGLRLRSCSTHAESMLRPLPFRRCLMTAVAPTTNALRRPSSPARVMTPSLTLPAG